ncbi:MAG: hypothetical protein K2N67_07750, partial [Mucispirillum sp.]|nr:hypothetical protein [Mucispirillum sp.]
LYPDKNNYSTPEIAGAYRRYGTDIKYYTYYDTANSYVGAIRSANKKIDETELLKNNKVIKAGSDYMMLMHKFVISGNNEFNDTHVLNLADSGFLYKGSSQKACKKLEESNSIECIMPVLLSKDKGSIYKDAIVVKLDIKSGRGDKYQETYTFLNGDEFVSVCGVNANGD